MPYSTPEKKKAHNQRYYKGWYAKNGRNRAIDYQEIINEWAKNNPEKIKAHRLVHQAIENGVIIKSTKCNNCGREVRLSGHQENYSKPLEVLWLCGSCHKLKHAS